MIKLLIIWRQDDEGIVFTFFESRKPFVETNNQRLLDFLFVRFSSRVGSRNFRNGEVKVAVVVVVWLRKKPNDFATQLVTTGNSYCCQVEGRRSPR